jgi:hypothetical protein
MVPRRMCWRIVEWVTPTLVATSETNRRSPDDGGRVTMPISGSWRCQPSRAEATIAPVSSTTLTVRTVPAATGSSTDHDP